MTMTTQMLLAQFHTVHVSFVEILQSDGEIQLDIRSSSLTAVIMCVVATSSSMPSKSESEMAEQIEWIHAGTATSSPAALLQCFFTTLVIDRTLRFVTEYLIRRRNIDELLLCFFVVLILIRVVDLGHLAIGLLDLSLGRPTSQTEDTIEVTATFHCDDE